MLRGSPLALILGLMVPLQAEPPAVRSCGLARDAVRLDALRASPSELLHVVGFADAIEASRRRFSIVRRHRRALGYLTRSELEALTARRELKGETLDLFWAEFQRLAAAPSPAD